MFKALDKALETLSDFLTEYPLPTFFAILVGVLALCGSLNP